MDGTQVVNVLLRNRAWCSPQFAGAVKQHGELRERQAEQNCGAACQRGSHRQAF
jgi:hypothetical protein